MVKRFFCNSVVSFSAFSISALMFLCVVIGYMAAVIVING